MDEKLVELIKRYKPSSAVDLIRIVKAYVQDNDSVVRFIEIIAAGNDGIAGTQDDLVPVEIVNTVKMLIQHDIVREIAEEVTIASKGSCFLCF